jgi:hypothetical protein
VKAGSKKNNCEFHLRDAKIAEVKAGSKKIICEFHLRDAKVEFMFVVLKDPAGGE